MLEHLDQRLVAEIGEHGPMDFGRFVDAALYDADQGFYATTGRAGGRQGDFVTSVEVGPLFAAVVGEWLDGVWRVLGEPQRFRVAEVGAGVGTLFRGINKAAPACFDALTYTLVERSSLLRAQHESLPGAAWVSEVELPADRQHVIVANELLDNLAFGIAERIADCWAPVMVAAADGVLALETGAADDALDYLAVLAPAAPLGARVPTARQAAAWVAQARLNADRVLVFDYVATTAELAERGQAGWLRTYAQHERASDPLADVGLRDITIDVPVDQLPTPTSIATQADWLHANGIDARVQAARQTWTERAHIGDLQAIAARSAIGEAEALCDPDGLGGFLALEWNGT